MGKRLVEIVTKKSYYKIFCLHLQAERSKKWKKKEYL